MSVRSHEEFQQNIGAYALGALPELEAELLEKHLATCATCRAEVEQLEPVTHALARSVPQFEPPPSLKTSLMRTVREEAALREAAEGRDRSEPRERLRLPVPGWFAGLRPRVAVAGSLAVLALGVVIGVAAVKLSQGPASRTLAAQVNHLGGGSSAALEVSSGDRQASVRLNGAPRPPAGRVYQLWIQRGKMIERGPVFTVDQSGRGSQSIPGGVRGADAVMVTVEKAPGAPAPTSAPILRFDV